ncbi:PAS-domain containing protein [Actibacterium pelagium]|uniref:histidine kinase n=1 Tax=Actibacterium pelagium TaxID=2029103 RepID=A0A917AH31_9RHOB|nr:PAS-domain containing protein [Actibacterium pelagium]GGE52381.1 signal transduction histidine kinase [Actibacterium pelagium]
MPQPQAERTRMTEAGLNLIQQALSIYDADLKLVVSNSPFREMFELPEHLFTPGADFAQTIQFLVERGEYGEVDDPAEFVQARVDQALTFESHYVERTRSNGRIISIEGCPLPQGGWVTVYTDITEIRRQEELLRLRSEELSDQLMTYTDQLGQSNRALAATNTALSEVQRQLTETEARTRTVTRMMPAHIAHVNPDGLYTFSNRKLPTILPGRGEEIIGLPIAEVLGDDAFSKLRPTFEDAMQGTAGVCEFTHDTSGRRIRVATTPDVAPDGTTNGVYILSTDVTEEAQARSALAQTHRRELAAQLTSGLAHDFANLLTIILGLQSQLERLNPADESAELIAATKAAVRRGGTLLDRIATMSDLRPVRPEPVNLPGLLREICTMARPSLGKQIALNQACSGFSSPLMLDAGSLQDSLLNLILNARDAIGDTEGRITVAARPVGDTWVELSVSDTGPGFSDTALGHATDPFFTTKGEEGSGLGLTMVVDATKLAGGRVILTNTEQGARVSLRYPLRKVTHSETPGMILLVEDSPVLRETIREELIAHGYSVIEAASAEEAAAMADLPGLTLVLSDFILAGERTGFDLLTDLKAQGFAGRMCLMTSLPENDARRQAAEGVFPILSKPFAPHKLAKALKEDPAQ